MKQENAQKLSMRAAGRSGLQGGKPAGEQVAPMRMKTKIRILRHQFDDSRSNNPAIVETSY